MRVCGVHHVGRSFAIPDALGREVLPGTDRWAVARVTFMDASTKELRAAHDVLSEFYANRLAAGFATVFWGVIPPEKEGASTQGYLIARKA